MGMLDLCKQLYCEDTSIEIVILGAVMLGYSEKTIWMHRTKVDRLLAEGFTVRVNRTTESQANVTVSGWA